MPEKNGIYVFSQTLNVLAYHNVTVVEKLTQFISRKINSII